MELQIEDSDKFAKVGVAHPVPPSVGRRVHMLTAHALCKPYAWPCLEWCVQWARIQLQDQRHGPCRKDLLGTQKNCRQTASPESIASVGDHLHRRVSTSGDYLQRQLNAYCAGMHVAGASCAQSSATYRRGCPVVTWRMSSSARTLCEIGEVARAL